METKRQTLIRHESKDKMCLLIANAVLLVVSIGILAVGAYIRANEGFSNSDAIALLNNMSFAQKNFGDITRIVSILDICSGTATFLVSILGVVCSLSLKRNMILLYLSILLLIGVFNVVAFGFSCQLLNSAVRMKSSEFEDLLKNFDGTGATDTFSKGWNALFITFDCCGASDVRINQNPFRDYPTKWWSNSLRNFDQIPYSCCEEATIGNYFNKTYTDCSLFFHNYQRTGCYTAVSRLLKILAGSVVGLHIFMFLLEIFISIVCLITFFCSSSQKGFKKCQVDHYNDSVFGSRTALVDSKGFPIKSGVIRGKSVLVIHDLEDSSVVTPTNTHFNGK
ncbi:hypothetical protein ACJMK2_026970 [Sinanodonta woodiana]|uniref:Tetraspanin n=1 Tax=Sinanodonta woodiana TaxID=1069815 RepID=A0ABD3XLC2_SINWO